MAAYYAKRAATYEEIYQRPERQDELLTLQVRVQELMEGHDVLELACGTGFWTEQIAASANSVLATDINPEMIALAKSKNLPADTVSFALQDINDFQPERQFTACFLGFWWSHVGRQDQVKFIAKLREKLGKDILLVMIDNSYVEEVSTPIARTDAEGNTYQFRTLPNGERYEIMKNFPTDSGLRKKLSPITRELRILRLEYYWLLSCRIK
ncbi:methyltransferase domain protein [Collimonas arenae]|uniref:Methyltransferase domain protein n=2 Tax=Collimonas arenae TaxID=279058 RepID=A0A127PU67_9BURK|nr:methyltransferase domain protein [Collimonas arenae]AMP11220.1 methyltransferase domain protein [Collimonas arenae]